MKEIDPNDPLAAVVSLDGDKSELELQPDGYEMYTPSADEKAALGEQYAKAIDDALVDHEPFFYRVQRNLEAYRGFPIKIANGGDPVLTLPIVGRVVDQMVAWVVTTVMRPEPIVKIDPELPGSYDVLVPTTVPGPPDPTTGQPGPPMQTALSMPKDVEEIAKALELGIEFELRQKQRFPRWLKTIAKDIYVNGVSWTKVVYERKTRPIMVQKLAKNPAGWVSLDGKEEREVDAGASIKLLNIPTFNMLMPLEENDPQESPWVAERIACTTSDLRAHLSNGDYPLIDPSEWSELLKQTTTEWMTNAEKQVRQKIDKRMPKHLSEKHDIWEVWFYHPVKVPSVDANGKSTTRYQMMSLCGQFHRTAKKFLVIYRNPYDHGMRPYEVFFEDEEANRFASESTVGKIWKHQALISQMLHLHIKNQIVANNYLLWGNPNTEAYDTLKDGENYPGRFIPGKYGEDWGAAPMGAPHTGLTQEIGMVSGDLKETAGQSDYTMGAQIPNRTPAGTVEQIMQAGYLKPLMLLESLSEACGRVIRLYLETKRQYEPFGSTVPVRDPETQAMLEVPMRLPVQEGLDNFLIRLTAAEEEASKETDERKVMLNQLLTANNQVVAQILGAAANPQGSPALTDIFMTMARGQVESVKDIIESYRRDSQRFIPSAKQFDALEQEREQAAQMMAMQQQMQQQMQGGMGEGSGGMAPMAPPANGGGMEGGAGAPGVGGGQGAPPVPAGPAPQ